MGRTGGGRYTIAVFVLSSLLVGCEKPEVAVMPELAPPPVTEVKRPQTGIPVRRVLQDSSGRSIDVTITGRTIDRLFIVRSADGLKAEIPISRLSESDQDFAHHLPIEPPPRDFFRQDPPPKKEKEAEDPAERFVKSREREIERLTQENYQLAAEMGVTSNGILKRTNKTKIQKNEEEIVRLRGDIERALSNAR